MQKLVLMSTNELVGRIPAHLVVSPHPTRGMCAGPAREPIASRFEEAVQIVGTHEQICLMSAIIGSYSGHDDDGTRARAVNAGVSKIAARSHGINEGCVSGLQRTNLPYDSDHRRAQALLT